MLKGFALRAIYIFFYIVGSYAVHIFVSRTLSPHEYGVYSFCLSIITITYIFLDNGLRQLLSRLGSRYPKSGKYLLRKGILVQSLISISLGLLVSLASNVISRIFHDTALTMPLILSGAVIIVQGISFVFPGILNGLKLFYQENLLMTAHAFTKPFFSIGLILLGFGVSGALVGPLFSSLIAVGLGFLFFSRIKGNARIKNTNAVSLYKELLPIIVIFGCITLIMNLDIVFVKFFSTSPDISGFYASASAIAKAPYWLLTVIGSTILPYISKAFFNNDIKKLEDLIITVIQTSIFPSFPVILFLSINSALIIKLLYGAAYSSASGYLALLIFAYYFLGIIFVLIHILIGVDKEKDAMKIMLIGVFCFLILNAFLTSNYIGFGAIISSLVTCIILLTFLTRNVLSIFLVREDRSKILSMGRELALYFFLIFFFAIITTSLKNEWRFALSLLGFVALEITCIKLKLIDLQKLKSII